MQVEAETPVVDDPTPEDDVVDDSQEPAEPDAAPEQDDDTPEPKLSRRDKRIDELTGKNYALEADRDYWRNRAIQLDSEPKPAEPAPAEELKPPTRPKLSEFDNDIEAYAEALADYTEESIAYTAAKKVAEISETARTTQQQTEESQARTESEQAFAKASQEFAVEHPDYWAVVGNPTLQINAEMTNALLQLENGPAITYHLGLHPEKAARIASKTPVQIAAELGKLSVEVTAKPAPLTETSNAPEPPTPVGGANAAAKKSAATAKTMREYVARRDKELGR